MLRVAALACLCAAIGSCDVATKYAPLKLDNPRIIVECMCSRSWPMVRLEPPNLSPPEIRVSEGCANLAFGKPVTTSDPEPILGEASLVTDGQKIGEGGFLEMSPGPQWVQVDLEHERRIDAIAIWHYLLDFRVVMGMVVEVSNDPKFEKGVVTVYNSDQTDKINRGAWTDLCYRETNLGKLIRGNGVKARYVRLYSAGNSIDDNNQYVEVEVWGR